VHQILSKSLAFRDAAQLYPDPYFAFMVNHPNTLISNSLGTLDAFGKAAARLRVPGGLPRALIGLRLYHAFVVSSSKIDYASTAVPLTVIQ